MAQLKEYRYTLPNGKSEIYKRVFVNRFKKSNCEKAAAHKKKRSIV